MISRTCHLGCGVCTCEPGICLGIEPSAHARRPPPEHRSAPEFEWKVVGCWRDPETGRDHAVYGTSLRPRQRPAGMKRGDARKRGAA